MEVCVKICGRYLFFCGVYGKFVYDGTESMYMSDFIVGRNAVLEALRSNRSINKLLVQQGATTGSIREVVALAREKKILIE